MAQKVTVQLVDDIDGGIADETVTFSLDGVAYEIDVTTAHAAELRESLASWIGHARKVSRAGAARPARRSARGDADASAVRDWAKANGLKVSERGRISASVRKAYEAAN